MHNGLTYFPLSLHTDFLIKDKTCCQGKRGRGGGGRGGETEGGGGEGGGY